MLNERAISLEEEVGEAVNKMKSGKAPGLDGFLVRGVQLHFFYYYSFFGNYA